MMLLNMTEFSSDSVIFEAQCFYVVDVGLFLLRLVSFSCFFFAFVCMEILDKADLIRDMV